MAPLLSTKRQAKKVSEANAWAAVLCCHWARRSLGPPCKQAESCCRPSYVACCPPPLPPLPPLGCGWAGAAGAWCYPASCLLSCTAQRAHVTPLQVSDQLCALLRPCFAFSSPDELIQRPDSPTGALPGRPGIPPEAPGAPPAGPVPQPTGLGQWPSRPPIQAATLHAFCLYSSLC
jgi:hypothetical protein